jgi:hypothetical protein
MAGMFMFTHPASAVVTVVNELVRTLQSYSHALCKVRGHV